MADELELPPEENDSDDDFLSQQRKQEAATRKEHEAALAVSNSIPSAKSPPLVTKGVLRDLGQVGARGEGFRNNTPINREQLRGEAQTRAFFKKTGQSKPSTQIDPYQMKDDAQALKEFYNPTQGKLKDQHFSPPTEYSDTTLAASNEAFNATPHRRGTMSEKSILHINPHQPNPLTKKGYGEASTSDLDRQAKSAAWMADPKNNKGRTEFRRYQSSPAEINPAILREQRIKAAYAKNDKSQNLSFNDIYTNYGPNDGSRGGTVKSPLGIYDTQEDTEEDKFLNKDQDLPDDFIGPAYKNNGTIHHTTQKWTENLKGYKNYDNGTFDKVYRQEVDNFVAKNPTYKHYLQRVGYSGFQVKEINPYDIIGDLEDGTYVPPKPILPTPPAPAPLPATPAPLPAAPVPVTPNPANPKGISMDRSRWKSTSKATTPQQAEDEKLESQYWSASDQQWITTNQLDQKSHTNNLARIVFSDQEPKSRNIFMEDLKNSIFAEIVASGNRNNRYSRKFSSRMKVTPPPKLKASLEKLASIKMDSLDQSKTPEDRRVYAVSYNDLLHKIGRDYLSWYQKP